MPLPYNFELHDIVMFTSHYHPSSMFYDRAMDQFDCLYEEAAERPKIMAIAATPTCPAYRSACAHVERTFAETP